MWCGVEFYLDIAVSPNSFLVGIVVAAIDYHTVALLAVGQAHLAWVLLPDQLRFQHLYRQPDACAVMAASDNFLGRASFRWATVLSDAAIVVVHSAEHRPSTSDSYLNSLIANGRLTNEMEYLVDLESENGEDKEELISKLMNIGRWRMV